MTRESLIYKIVQSLNENGALDVNNYLTGHDQLNDVKEIIEKELDGYLLIKGEVI